MKSPTVARDPIVIEPWSVKVLFLRIGPSEDGFIWEIRCYGTKGILQRSTVSYRTTAMAHAAGLAALTECQALPE